LKAYLRWRHRRAEHGRTALLKLWRAYRPQNTLKTFVMKNGKPFLKAENPKYPDLIPSEELVIQGVFRALIRRAKE
jgi:SOS-response transcriptional repressor LexA